MRASRILPRTRRERGNSWRNGAKVTQGLLSPCSAYVFGSGSNAEQYLLVRMSRRHCPTLFLI